MAEKAPPPLQFRYCGEGHFEPENGYWATRADNHYVIGEVYGLSVHQDRSARSQSHYFATIKEAWKNLPEDGGYLDLFPSTEHLRKFALIRCGFCDVQSFACGTKVEAERWARNLKPFDDYSIVLIEGTTVRRYTAQSQDHRSMSPKAFQESKTRVLDYLASIIRVPIDDLRKQAGRSA